MGAAMDPKLLKAGVQAHHKAIGSLTGNNLVLSKADFESINAAIGRMIASVPESKTMAALMDSKSAFDKTRLFPVRDPMALWWACTPALSSFGSIAAPISMALSTAFAQSPAVALPPGLRLYT